MKILGIDLGVGSIGWALVDLNGETPSASEIVQTGVRIVPVTDQADDFRKGKSVTINSDRTRYRGTRRNKHRWKLRRKQLKKLLEKNGMLPDKALMELETHDPYNLHQQYADEARIDIKQVPPPPVSLKLYHLRQRAANQRIELDELGRVLLHLLQKRGFKSNRKSNSKEDTELVSIINENSTKLEGTPGEHYFKKFETYYQDLLKRQKDKTLPIPEIPRTKTDVRFKADKNKNKDAPKADKENRTFKRDTYFDEFNRIWREQKKHYPDILTKDLKHEIGTRCIFYQRDLKSQKSKVSRCQFERGYNVTPKSSLFFQELRIWLNVNNLEISDDEGNKYKLARDKDDTEETALIKAQQRRDLFNYLNDKIGEKNVRGSVTPSSVIGKLGYKPIKKFDLNFEEVQRNKTRAQWLRIFKEHNLLKEATHAKKGILNFDACGENPENQTAYKLWHLIYSVENPEHLTNAIEKILQEKIAAEKMNITKEKIRTLAEDLESNITYKPEYGNLSTKAIKKILPYLREGYKYSDACKFVHEAEQANGRNVNYLHSHYETAEDIEERKEHMKTQKFEPKAPIPRGSVRNPVVEKILNQLINLLNEIVQIHGRPQEIRVELARELKRNAKQRDKMDKAMRATKKQHIEIREKLLNEYNLPRVSRNDIIRYKLWEETEGISLYSGKKIPIHKIFSSEYQIDHIIPQARLFDDSFSNKTLSEWKRNQLKGARTAYDFIATEYPEELQDYIQNVNKIKSKIKRDKLLMTEDKIPDDFIERQKKDSQYIAKKAMDILRYYTPVVNSTSGSVTDTLRHQWGLTDVMKEINYDKYKALDRIHYIETKTGKKIMQIKDWSKRDDHRHHAVDAIVIACTKQRVIQQLNNLNKEYEERISIKKSAQSFKPLWEDFRNDAQKAIENILISFRSKQRIATKNINTHYTKDKDGKRTIHKQTILTPRGQLHKEKVYGETKLQNKDKTPLDTKFKLETLKYMQHPHEKAAVQKRLAEYDNDPKKAFKNLDDHPIFAEGSNKPITAVTTWRRVYTIRKPINELNEGQIQQIIDPKIRELLMEKDVDLNNVWLDKKVGIRVKSATIVTTLKSPKPLHKNEKGKAIDFVNLRKNHHATVYRDEKGNYYDEVVSFWDAFKRYKKLRKQRKNKHERFNVIKTTDLPEGHEFVVSLIINEMFVKDLDPDEIDFFDPKNYPLISKHLYRVQKLAKKDYMLRHHLATTLNYKHDEQRIQSLQKLENFTKVTINRLGIITDVQKII